MTSLAATTAGIGRNSIGENDDGGAPQPVSQPPLFPKPKTRLDEAVDRELGCGMSEAGYIVLPSLMPGFRQTGAPVEGLVTRDFGTSKKPCKREVAVRVVPGALARFDESAPHYCPDCGRVLEGNGPAAIELAHLPMGSEYTRLSVSRPRMRCPDRECGYSVTLAVPFNVSSQMLGYLTSTYGMSVKQLASTTLENEGKTLMLTFTDATEMVAGTPYLVKVTTDFDFSAQALPDVVISKELHPVTTTYADFIPTLGKTTIEGVDAENILFVAAGNLLKHPAEMPADMKGFRAYFQLNGVAAQARSFSMDLGDGEITGIKAIDNGQLTIDNDRYYDLQGRKVNAAQKGVYIQNGKKVIIRSATQGDAIPADAPTRSLCQSKK